MLRRIVANDRGRAYRVAAGLADQALMSGANFATGVLVGRACTKSEFGSYGMALATLLLLAEAHHALVSTPHQVLWPRHGEADRPRLNGDSLLASLAVGVVAAIGLSVVALAGGGGVWAALAVVAWAYLARYFVRVLCFSTRRPAAALALDAAGTVLQLGLIGGLYAVDRLGPATALLAIGVANAMALIGWLLTNRRHVEVRASGAVDGFRRGWPVGRWIFVSGLLWAAGTHLYPLIVGGVRGAGEAGVWTACFALAALANPLLLGVQNLLGPAVAHAAADLPRGRLLPFVASRSIAFAALMVPFALLMLLGGELLLRVYGDTYAGAGGVIAVLGVSGVVHAGGFPSSRALVAIDAGLHDVAANSLTLALTATAGTLLVLKFGAFGAAVALVVAEAVGNAYRISALIRLTRGAA